MHDRLRVLVPGDSGNKDFFDLLECRIAIWS